MTTAEEKIIVYTDGGSRGNPGPAAAGVVVKDPAGRMIKSFGKALGTATNNEAEYAAVVLGLQKVKALLGKEKIKNMRVEMRMDSQLVCRQLSGGYKIEQERLFPYFIKVWNLKMDFGEVLFSHVPREQNREADTEVNRALDREQGELFVR